MPPCGEAEVARVVLNGRLWSGPCGVGATAPRLRTIPARRREGCSGEAGSWAPTQNQSR